jgi:glycine/D-amino acid oxidase-like deaminating enzyme
LQTAEGEVQHHPCRRAVLCSGAWSQKLVPELPVFPVKGQMLSLQGPRKALKTRDLWPRNLSSSEGGRLSGRRRDQRTQCRISKRTHP